MDFLKTRLLDTLSDQIRKIQKVSKNLWGRRGESLGVRQGQVTGFQLDGSTVDSTVQNCMATSHLSQLMIVIYWFSIEKSLNVPYPGLKAPIFNNKYFVIVCF